MAAIPALVTASTKLHNSTGLTDEDHDCQIRDHVAHCRNLLSTKALSSVSRDESVLDVSRFFLGLGHPLQLTVTSCRTLIQDGILSSISFFSVCKSKPSRKRPMEHCLGIYYPREDYG